MKRLKYYLSVIRARFRRLYFRLNLNSYTLKRQVVLYDDVKKAPIFIVGCGHSGTSLLLALLDAHPKIYGVPDETKMFTRKLKYLENWISRIEKDLIRQKKARWVEKTPQHIHHIRHILQKWPQAKIIYIIRDPKDTVASLFSRYNDLEVSITRWVHDNNAGIRHREHPNIHVIKYEDLIVDQEKYLTELFNFLDEDFNPQVLNFFQKKRLYYSNRDIGRKNR